MRVHSTGQTDELNISLLIFLRNDHLQMEADPISKPQFEMTSKYLKKKKEFEF